jgi:cytochrome c oxidase assembly protein subunit 15
LLLYPWQSWLAAPFDLFIEHGHRLLGAAAGLLAMALVAVVLAADRRRWLIAAAFGALGLVVLQGVLGGARVLFDARLVAMIHGCVGPLFFAYVGALIVATSKWWNAAGLIDSPAGRRLLAAAGITMIVAYAQLVVGAVVRHVPIGAAPSLFRAALVLHLLLAGGLAVHALALPWRVRRLDVAIGGLRLPAWLIPALVLAQVVLGAGTYVAKYGFPAWLGDYTFAAGYVIQEKSLLQSLVTTAHVANGSLILFVSVVLALRSARLFFLGQAVSLPVDDRCGKLAAGPYAGRAA